MSSSTISEFKAWLNHPLLTIRQHANNDIAYNLTELFAVPPFTILTKVDVGTGRTVMTNSSGPR